MDKLARAIINDLDGGMIYLEIDQINVILLDMTNHPEKDDFEVEFDQNDLSYREMVNACKGHILIWLRDHEFSTNVLDQILILVTSWDESPDSIKED